MYENAKSCVRLEGQLNDEFNIKVGVHQGPPLSPLLFVIAMEALLREFRIGCPWELLYADDLVLMAETFEDLKGSSQSGKIISRQKGSASTSIKQSLYATNTIHQESQIPQNGHAVFVTEVLALTQSSAKAVTTGFTRDAQKSKEG